MIPHQAPPTASRHFLTGRRLRYGAFPIDPGRTLAVPCAVSVRYRSGRANLDEQTHQSRKLRDERPVLRIAVRLAYIYWAEEESRRRLGRPLTKAELERVVLRYPGDV
jgi:hypothetical protein